MSEKQLSGCGRKQVGWCRLVGCPVNRLGVLPLLPCAAARLAAVSAGQWVQQVLQEGSECKAGCSAHIAHTLGGGRDNAVSTAVSLPLPHPACHPHIVAGPVEQVHARLGGGGAALGDKVVVVDMHLGVKARGGWVRRGGGCIVW